MSKDRRSFRLWLAAAAAMFGLCSTPALADGCEPLVAALLKGNSVPWHSTVTLMMQTTVKDKAEVVSLPDAIYSRSGKGEWKKKPRDAAAAAVQIAKDWERKTCRADGTETIGGVPADIIVYRVSTRFWIARDTGLILQSVVKEQPNTVTSLYDYAGIHAPL